METLVTILGVTALALLVIMLAVMTIALTLMVADTAVGIYDHLRQRWRYPRG